MTKLKNLQTDVTDGQRFIPVRFHHETKTETYDTLQIGHTEAEALQAALQFDRGNRDWAEWNPLRRIARVNLRVRRRINVADLVGADTSRLHITMCAQTPVPVVNEPRYIPIRLDEETGREFLDTEVVAESALEAWWATGEQDEDLLDWTAWNPLLCIAEVELREVGRTLWRGGRRQ
ncbi:MAG: hypothetical protein IAE79_02600 [Anaerolinea sp.]|nr:hypothetical protein [Anaerolinea sp.]